MAWFTTDWFSSHHTVRCAHKSGDVINLIIVALHEEFLHD